MPMPDVELFAETGYLGPVRVLSTDDCARFLRALAVRRQLPLDWDKGTAVTSRVYYELATHPTILDLVSELLEDSALLWGASLLRRDPDEVHPWHSDIESSAPESKTVSVWMGLEHTRPESSLLLLPYSHRFGVTVQQVRHENGKAREDASIDDLVQWAREREPRSELVTTAITDGEAVFFDGRLWHGTHNISRQVRRAVLLQYAAPDTSIRMPDLSYLDWPFRQLDQPRPPCLMVRGSAKVGPNRVVPAPVADIAEGAQLTSRIHPLRLPLEPDEETGWKWYQVFNGSTADLPNISCHASILLEGHSPHPPHGHDEEELLLLLRGEVELVFSETDRAPLRTGEFAYYPADFAHTLRTASADPAMYVIFKWRGASVGVDSPLDSGRFETASNAPERVLFEEPTRYLRRLHSHVTVLEPGGGYEPHVDAYDVAIVVLEGELETIGGRAAPHDVIFYRAGEAHGMRNVGSKPARYVVFEFHGRTSVATDAPSSTAMFLGKVSDPRRWKRKLKKLLRR
jgi:quercetin dioxygenase-like cupin family protein